MHVRSDEIVAVARSLDGIRYGKQGRLVKRNIHGDIILQESRLDCAGVIWYCAYHLGLSTHNVSNYGERPDPVQFRKEIIQGGATAVRFDDLCPADILLLTAPRWPVHSAIYLGPNPETNQPEMVHAWLPAKKVCVVPYGRVEKDKLSSIFRFPE